MRAEVVFDRDWITQTVRLDAGSRRLSVHLEVNWQLDRKLLKVAFPLAVHATDVTYEVAFGAVQRPTHYSSRADLARYEVPGHRWADMSEHGFGVAVLTDSKYGYSAFGNTLRISLLRAPCNPDPEADRGTHTFAYALLPHAGTWQDAGVVAEAAAFNSPIRFGAVPSSLASATGGLVLDTIKRAEDSDALILRLYEPHGGRGTARVRVPARQAFRANILEEPGDELTVQDGEILVPFRPWEIVTVYAPRPRPRRRSRSSRSRSSRPCAARSPRTPRRRRRGSCRRTRHRAPRARPGDRPGVASAWSDGSTVNVRTRARARGWSRRRRRPSAAAPRPRRARGWR